MSKSSRRLRDKWRQKKWYTVNTPSYFGEIEIGNIPSEIPDKVLGRTIESTLYDITNDFSHQSIKLNFLVSNLTGQKAQTILKGHEYSSDYLRSLVRRGSSRIDGIFNIKTKDNYITRVSIVAFTRNRIKSSQEQGIRALMNKVMEEKAQELTFDQLSHEMVLGKVGSDIYNLAKKIMPLRHVGVRKSKLIGIPKSTSKKIKKIDKVEPVEETPQ